MIRPETEAAWPSEDVSKLGGFPGRSPKSLVDMQSAMEEKNKRLICLKEAPLKEEELIGGRLYTGPLFTKYNSVLRGVDSTSDFLQTQFISLCCAKEVGERFEKSDKSSTDFSAAKAHANLYTSTLHAINSTIVKMSKLTRAATVYRGIANKALPAKFWEKNEFGVCGGVEAAFMSTTTMRDVAMGYAGEGSAGVVFEIQMGMVRRPLTHRPPHPTVSRTAFPQVDRGAELEWLSQYPHEKEILFGPLTGLEVLSVRVDGKARHRRPPVDVQPLPLPKCAADPRQAACSWSRCARASTSLR